MDRTREVLDRLVAWSPVLLLGALAALTYWLDAQVQAPAPRRDGSARHDPDLFLQDFKAITFDAQGKPRETLSAQRAEHFPDDESAELTLPRLALSEPGRPTMTITADRGRIDGDRNQGDFLGNVRVERDAARRALPRGLTDGQADILRWVTSGQTNREIAAQLDTNEQAVAEELEKIFETLGVSSKGQATAVAVMEGVA